MTNAYAVAVPLLLFASAYVGYAGLQSRTQRAPRLVRTQMDTLPIKSNYRIPDPFVEPMKPKGIRVSIPDAPGIELFGFHGSLNNQISGFQAGNFNGDVTRPVNGRWSFVDRNLKTKPGDVLHFWVFVQNSGLGYRKDNFRFTVRDLKEVTLDPSNVKPSIISRPPPTESMVPENTNPVIGATIVQMTKPNIGTTIPETINPSIATTIGQNTRPNVATTFTDITNPNELTTFPDFTNPSVTSIFPEINNLREPKLTELNNSIEEDSVSNVEFQKVQSQLNETLALLSSLNEKIDPLNRELKLLREIITDLARSTTSNNQLILRHSGARIPGNALELVRSIVVERLGLTDLYSKILAATQIPDGIVFDVVSMYEKRLILSRAQEELRTSKFKIEEYNAEIPSSNTNCARVVDEIQFPTTSTGDAQQPTGVTFDRDFDQNTFTTLDRDSNRPTVTTLGREPDQPTDILPTDSLDSYEDDIAKKIDIRMASGEEVTTSL